MAKQSQPDLATRLRRAEKVGSTRWALTGAAPRRSLRALSEGST
jgi:hypothetical protein